jgi:hypothetical protein
MGWIGENVDLGFGAGVAAASGFMRWIREIVDLGFRVDAAARW